MSLLAPLYIAGLLAISLPIIFHLIRRTPHGRQPFSSLMFLQPSPPTLTRRSRLNNILLLLLRAAALALLAFAFARPFLRQDADAAVAKSQGRRIGILVDASASMQRGDLWQQASKRVDEVLVDVTPADEVGLFFFDRAVRPAMTFSEWTQTDPAQRSATLRARFAAAAGPTWSATKVGEAVATVADLLAEAEGSQRATDSTGRQLVLISDMQQGGHVEALQGYQWPANVLLDVKPVALKQASNAYLELVEDAADVAPDPNDANRLRVRVTNQADSNREQFAVMWGNAQGSIATIEPVKLYVPPGRSQVARVPWPRPDQPADRLILEGDDADFDNVLYLVPPRKETFRVVYLGDDDAADIKGLRYYFENAISNTPRRQMELVAKKTSEPLNAPDLLDARLLLITTALTDDRIAAVRNFVQSGGHAAWILRDTASAQGLPQLMPIEGDVQEAAVKDFSLISRVAFDHPLFAPFSESRFADFTKVHFWKHRKLTPSPLEGEVNGLGDRPRAGRGEGERAANKRAFTRILAWFDNGDPFLVEHPIDKGTLLVATAGWHPADSQLALSTKFVPLIEGLLRRHDGLATDSQYAVGDPIPVPGSAKPLQLITPDGAKLEVPANAISITAANRPGIYQLVTDGGQTPIAVNLDADESRTTPIAAHELSQWGAKLGSTTAETPADALATKRQLQMIELENRQKLWRWLILAVLAILAVETALAGRLARRTLEQQVPT
jgi:hypothetical protein